MNTEAREFLNKLGFSDVKNSTIVFLRTPSNFRSIIDFISREISVSEDRRQAGNEYLVVFVNNSGEIIRTITRYVDRMSENGKIWFISNRQSLLDDENNFLTLINAQFISSTSLIELKDGYQAKLFQLKDNISNVANIEHYRTKKRQAMK